MVALTNSVCWHGQWVEGAKADDEQRCSSCGRPFDLTRVESDGVMYAHRCNVYIYDRSGKRAKCALPNHYSHHHASYISKGETVRVYTDGGYRAGIGGWGWWNPLSKESAFGSFVPATNQRMELYAALDAMDRYLDEPNLVIVSDSAYLINVMQNEWYKRWLKNGWMNSKGEPVANEDLWRAILAYLDDNKTVRFEKVKGHSGDVGNDHADKLATQGIMERLTARKRIDELRQLIHIYMYTNKVLVPIGYEVKSKSDIADMVWELQLLQKRYPGEKDLGYEAEAFSDLTNIQIPKTKHVAEKARALMERKKTARV